MSVRVNGGVFGVVSIDFGGFYGFFYDDFGFGAPVGGSPEAGAKAVERFVEEVKHCGEVGWGREEDYSVNCKLHEREKHRKVKGGGLRREQQSVIWHETWKSSKEV